MSQIPPGPYHIQKHGGQLITFTDAENGAPALLLPPSGNPKDQEWQVQRASDGGYTFKNTQTGKYLGFEGPPEVNKLIVTTDEPKEWELRQSNGPFTFFLVVPGGPVGPGELIIDLSDLLIFPPRLALRPVQSSNSAAWQFQSLH
ncbi:carbohydrate-binding module family 13 protein [Botryobasidium botryosum FD-172 SS1]|uniref:Carbohydrate-binding module family 13 protein n=1 Tax=Botryobasidium botryosum (strain FD-172 SS1) TaxID=930990 RepID=A0A067LYF5_BOTB1|nr:carbohydrate-binding module family 13 protein [Botryobasidium botryosum FD-172 SS1]